jgi:hypothetical protein
MHEGIGPSATLRREDMQTLVEIVESRFAEPGREASRIAVVRDWLTAGFELNRMLTLQTRCALVNHFGTKGNSNLTDQTDRLFDALAIYATLTAEIAGEFEASDLQDTAPESSPIPKGTGRWYAGTHAAGAER